MSFPRLAQALLNGQPYFGPALRSLQAVPERYGCFLPVARRAAAARGGPIAILEVGSWAGASAVSWAKAVGELGCGGSVTCVDLWQPYFDAGKETDRVYRDMNEAAGSGDVFRLFLHNLRACGVDRLVSYRRGDSRQVLLEFDAASFDIVYIDGNHDYPTVRSDIASAKRLVRPGGIICGDDLELQRAALDVGEHEAYLTAGVDYACSTKNSSHYHPGVTEAVAAEFGDVAVCHGFWAIQSQEGGWRPFEISDHPVIVPDHIRESVENDRVELVGEGSGFNFVRAGGSYLAFDQSLAAIDPLVERVGERDLGTLVLVGSTMDEVQRKAQAAKAERTRFERGLAEAVMRRLSDGLAAAEAAAEKRFAEVSQQIESATARLEQEMTQQVAAMDARLNRLEERLRRGFFRRAGAYLIYLATRARGVKQPRGNPRSIPEIVKK